MVLPLLRAWGDNWPKLICIKKSKALGKFPCLDGRAATEEPHSTSRSPALMTLYPKPYSPP